MDGEHDLEKKIILKAIPKAVSNGLIDAMMNNGTMVTVANESAGELNALRELLAAAEAPVANEIISLEGKHAITVGDDDTENNGNGNEIRPVVVNAPGM